MKSAMDLDVHPDEEGFLAAPGATAPADAAVHGASACRRSSTRPWVAACFLIQAWTMAAGAEVSPSTQHAEIDAAVEDLGSADWSRRERAQALLLEAGSSAVPALERAARAENPELAHRAGFLLDRIDPEVAEFRCIKVELGTPSSVVDVQDVSGIEGQDLTSYSTGDPPRGEAYWFRYHLLSRAAIDVEATQSLDGTQRIELRKPLQQIDAVSILKCSEEGVYRRLGLHLERKRTRYLTLVLVRHGRCSRLAGDPCPQSGPDALQDLVRRLTAQASHELPSVRREALLILAELGAPEAERVFRAAMGDPETRFVAAIGRGDRDRILRVLGEEGTEPEEVAVDSTGAPGGQGAETPAPGGKMDADETPAILDGDVACRAILRLIPGETRRAIRPTLARLDAWSPFELHSILGAFADLPCLAASPGRATAEAPAAAEARASIWEAFTSSEVLARVPWNDVETEYFYTRLIDSLDPRVGADADRARAFLESMERLLRGEIGSLRPPAKICIDLWRRTARRMPEASSPSEKALLLRVLPSAEDPTSLSEIMALIEGALAVEKGSGSARAGEELDLARLLAILGSKIEGGDPALAARSLQWLLRVTRILLPREGRLRTIVPALLRAGKAAALQAEARGAAQGFTAPVAYSARQIEEELGRWTGVTARRPTRGTAGPFDPEPWQQWLTREADVRAREDALIRDAEGTASGKQGSPGRSVVAYEFDLEIDEPGARSGARVPGARPFTVLDGRRLELALGTTVSYRDRWDNDLSIRVDDEGRAVGSLPERFRVNRRQTLYAGLPLLAAVPEKELSVLRHETSDVLPGSRVIISPSQEVPTLRTVILVTPAESDPGPSPTDARALWDRFLSKHVLDLGPNPHSSRLASLLALARALRFEGRTNLLQRLLAESPTVEVAQMLGEAGDPGGLEFLRTELRSDKSERRISAAVAICDLGIPEGARHLIDLSRSDPVAAKRLHYQILNSLDRYLRGPSVEPAMRDSILDLLFSQISDPALQHRAFSLIQRETGQDFGYNAARAITDAEGRKAAMEAAVRRAGAWRNIRKP